MINASPAASKAVTSATMQVAQNSSLAFLFSIFSPDDADCPWLIVFPINLSFCLELVQMKLHTANGQARVLANFSDGRLESVFALILSDVNKDSGAMLLAREIRMLAHIPPRMFSVPHFPQAKARASGMKAPQ